MNRLLGAILDLPVKFHAKAYRYTGLARYFARPLARGRARLHVSGGYSYTMTLRFTSPCFMRSKA